MTPIILVDNENGTSFRYEKIPANMFNFYILHKKTYKNGKSLWHICVEIAKAPAGKSSPDCIDATANYIKLESLNGTKEQAKARLNEIVKEYK